MTDIENSNKEQLNEAATISISAETGAEIADMIAAMQGHAGMQSKPVGGDMPMPMRHDIEKFRAAMDDDPAIPGRDDVEGDQDLQQGVIGSIAGGLGGAALGSALGGPLGAMAGDALGGVGGKIAGDVGSKIGSAIGKAAPSVAGSMIGSEIGDKITGEETEGYDNEPNPEYQDHKHMTKDLSGGINREKKAYAKAQDGDNAMAVEAIKAQLMAALEEKKAKPDYIDIDGDGDKKEPMKKAVKDKESKKNN